MQIVKNTCYRWDEDGFYSFLRQSLKNATFEQMMNHDVPIEVFLAMNAPEQQDIFLPDEFVDQLINLDEEFGLQWEVEQQ